MMTQREIMLRYGRTPYKKDGADFDGFDCAGFIILYFRENYGVTLPKNLMRSRHFFRRLKKDETPQRDDLAMMTFLNAKGLVDHVALFVSPNELIHCGSAFNGLVCQPTSLLGHKILSVMRPRVER